MADLHSLHTVIAIAFGLVSAIVLMGLIAWRMDCRARRLEARRRAKEASYRDAQAALDRAIKHRRERGGAQTDFRYTPE